jgi:hypothetical protein
LLGIENGAIDPLAAQSSKRSRNYLPDAPSVLLGPNSGRDVVPPVAPLIVLLPVLILGMSAGPPRIITPVARPCESWFIWYVDSGWGLMEPSDPMSLYAPAKLIDGLNSVLSNWAFPLELGPHSEQPANDSIALAINTMDMPAFVIFIVLSLHGDRTVLVSPACITW